MESFQFLKEKVGEFLLYLQTVAGPLTDECGWDYFDEKTRSCHIQQDMHDDLEEAVEAYLERLKFIEMNIAAKSNPAKNKAIYPVSRKRNLENADAVFFIKFLHGKFMFCFKKPCHDYVAAFINAVFDTCYDYAAITQIVRKR